MSTRDDNQAQHDWTPPATDAAPAPPAPVAPSDASLRVLQFVEKLDKRLADEGYAPECRHAVVRALYEIEETSTPPAPESGQTDLSAALEFPTPWKDRVSAYDAQYMTRKSRAAIAAELEDWRAIGQSLLATQPSAQQAGKATDLPGWERGIATVTMSGHQLREALDFINPDGDDDPEQRDNDLTFGIVQHKDDDGKPSTGLCCWNDDTDGVLPLDGEPAPLPTTAPQESGELAKLRLEPIPWAAVVQAIKAVAAEYKKGESPRPKVFHVSDLAAARRVEEIIELYADFVESLPDWPVSATLPQDLSAEGDGQ